MVHRGRILLIKHRKLGLWMAPGGHVDPNELPHQAAEREFFEESGVKGRAIDVGQILGQKLQFNSNKTQYLPIPIFSNLHWVSQQNYRARQGEKIDGNLVEADPLWRRGCEQHLAFTYLLEPVDDQLQPKLNREETTACEWKTLAEVRRLKDISPDIKQEIELVFEVVTKCQKKLY